MFIFGNKALIPNRYIGAGVYLEYSYDNLYREHILI